MERQYIGARYVPKFADPIEWNDQTSYEALTIVTYLGASYTSKKAVSAGIRPTDNRYWVVTSNYNAQVEEYRQLVVDMQNTFNAAMTKLPTAVNSRWVTVGTEGCNFKTINEAINAVKNYATSGNRVTIFITSGFYPEEIVLLPNNGIDFVGVGRVIVQYASVYPRAPLFISGDTYIENIHFVATESTYSSYAVHLEAQADSTPSNIKFNNCEFTATNNHGVGVGLGDGYSIDFNECRFIGQTGSGLYAHNYPQAQSGNQVLLCYNCSFYGFTGVDIWLEDAKDLQGNSGSSACVVGFANCVGSNGHIRYKDSTGTYTYLPKTSELVLQRESVNTITGVDYYKRIINWGGFITVAPNGFVGLPYVDADLYNFTIERATKVTDEEDVKESITVVSAGNGTINLQAAELSNEQISITLVGVPK